MIRWAGIAFLSLLVAACGNDGRKPKVPVTYTGPVAVARDIETMYKDSAYVKVRVMAPLRNEFSNGDSEYPKGITIKFYNSKGLHESTITARYAQYDRASDTYQGKGNVVVENHLEKKRLDSEELRWNHMEKRVFTDQFVRITTPTEVVTGMGLTASEDFKQYKILKVQGIFEKQPMF